jgi:AcrR family transcriptional regulator
LGRTGSRGGAAARARRSQEALAGALLGLLTSRDLRAVSISEVTKRAGVSRSTFYEHYSDVHDLATTVCLQVFDRLVEGAPMMNPEVLPSLRIDENPLLPLFAHVGEHAQLYRALLGPDGSARVINHLLHRISIRAYTNIRVDSRLTPAPGEPADIPFDPEAAVVAGVIVAAIMDWLRQGCPGSSAELAQAVWGPLLGAVSAGNGLGRSLVEPPGQPADQPA